MLNPLIKQIPVVGQAYGFIKIAMKVYNSTSPVEAVKGAAVSIIDECFYNINIRFNLILMLYDIKNAMISIRCKRVWSNLGTLIWFHLDKISARLV